ncbi:Uma2 family endonuclease [Streptomyces orinoci]|uniref:Uma2 family endonuclease n=1 Tax=Streptomyces orinoci TaxID=67339 RepID=A0ABV3JR15_STRON|nr:Uma2 family endonuclease [Streptomyces orinoci]
MAVLDRLWREVETMTPPEGYVVEIIDGRVIMTPQSPTQSNTIRSITRQAERALGEDVPLVFDVAIDFPGETSSAPDVSILDLDAQPRGKRYVCQDVVAAIEVVSSDSDDQDYVTKVAKYGRFGIETYLIIDPFKRVCTLYEGALPTGYAKRSEYAYGQVVEVDLVDGRKFVIDTSGFPVEA